MTEEQQVMTAAEFQRPGRPQANADDLAHTPNTARISPERIAQIAAMRQGDRPRVYGDPRDTKEVSPAPGHAAASTPDGARDVINRIKASRAEEVAAAAPAASEQPPEARPQAPVAAAPEPPREPERPVRREPPREPEQPRRVERAAPPREPDRPARAATPPRENNAVATPSRSTPAKQSRLSRWNLPKITRQVNQKPLFIQTSEGLLSDRQALGDQFPKFMVFVTVIGIILSVGSTINAVQFVIGELAKRHILGITLVQAVDGTMGMSTGWKFVAIFLGSVVAAGIAWGQAQLSDQLTNNQSLAFWTLELLDMGMTYFFIAPVVGGILLIILELNKQAFYTAAGAEIAVVAAFMLNQAVRSKRMDEELDPFWFKAFLIVFFVVGNILSRMALPLFGDIDTAEGVTGQVQAASFGINSFISFLSAYVPEQTAFGSRLRRVGRKDTAASGAA